MEMPHDQRAENAVLGCLMLDGLEALERCHRLRADMFYLTSHQTVYAVLREIAEEGRQPDPMLVAEWLAKRGALEAVGGHAFLSDLGKDLPRRFDPHAHVDRIIEKWKLRRGITICDRYTSQFQAEDGADDLLAAMQGDVFDAMQEKALHVDPLVMAFTIPTLKAFMHPDDTPAGLGFGIPQMDSITGGMRPKEVTVIGARSGVGKSSLMCQVAAIHCPQGVAMDLFSLEMPKETLLHRLWSIASNVPFSKIHHPLRCEPWERRAVQEAALRVAEWPLRIHDDAELTLGHIASLARLSARRNRMKLFAVDYAQIVNAEGKDERLRVASVSRTLTKLAKSESVHLMLLSQLRKVPAEQYSRAPHIADLRETGQLENDAHLVALLHRGWDEQTGSISHDAEVLLPKHRNGVTGTIPAKFNPANLTFGGA